jgi:hypothetical protein
MTFLCVVPTSNSKYVEFILRNNCLYEVRTKNIENTLKLYHLAVSAIYRHISIPMVRTVCTLTVKSTAFVSSKLRTEDYIVF